VKKHHTVIPYISEGKISFLSYSNSSNSSCGDSVQRPIGIRVHGECCVAFRWVSFYSDLLLCPDSLVSGATPRQIGLRPSIVIYFLCKFWHFVQFNRNETYQKPFNRIYVSSVHDLLVSTLCEIILKLIYPAEIKSHCSPS